MLPMRMMPMLIVRRVLPVLFVGWTLAAPGSVLALGLGQGTEQGESPGEAPGEAPSEPLTESPSEPLTESPSEPLTGAPSEPLTEAPSEPLTESPSEPLTESPSEPLTGAPSEPLTGAPSEPLTGAPSEPLTEAPSEPLTEAPSEPLTEAPSEPLTGAPSEPLTEALSEPLTEPTAHHTIHFSADEVNYDTKKDILVALGNVILKRDADKLRADTIEWNRHNGKVIAHGNVAIINAAGDMIYADRIMLTDSLRDGAIENLLITLDTGARLAANHGRRFENGNIALRDAIYTPCPIDDGTGCTRNPSWRIRAVKVFYDRVANRIKYKGAYIDLLGVSLIPLPGFSHIARSEAGSGLLVPRLQIGRVNGLAIAQPYYLRLSSNRDLTLTPHLYTGSAPLFEGEYRALTSTGAYRINGYATYSSVVPLAAFPAVRVGDELAQREDIRGYLETSGKFQLSKLWSIHFSGRIASDRTLLRRYDISRDDRLRSTFEVERSGSSSHFSFAGWGVQTLRTNDRQGLQPIALPVIDFRQRLSDPVFNGQLEIQANSLAISRTSGQDMQRAFASARWDLRRLTSWGQDLRLTALVRGDAYHSNANPLPIVSRYEGTPGWQTRAIFSFGAEMRWPFIGEIMGGTQKLTPHIQIVATPSVRNVSVPNEDSRAFDLEESNIFELNRFPGYDRFEDGSRITYGLEWKFDRPGLAISSVIAQSYRLSSQSSLFPTGTGLADKTSDIVGRTTVSWRDWLRLTSRFRLDKDDLKIRRSEWDTRFGSRKTYALLSYLRLNRSIINPLNNTAGAFIPDEEQPANREEVRAAARIAFVKNWSVFGSAIIDLTDKSEDPSSSADGFEPIRHRLGIAYDDETLSLAITWRRDYEDTGDARRGNSFLFRVAFRNLGF